MYRRYYETWFDSFDNAFLYCELRIWYNLQMCDYGYGWNVKIFRQMTPTSDQTDNSFRIEKE